MEPQFDQNLPELFDKIQKLGYYLNWTKWNAVNWKVMNLVNFLNKRDISNPRAISSCPLNSKSLNNLSLPMFSYHSDKSLQTSIFWFLSNNSGKFWSNWGSKDSFGNFRSWQYQNSPRFWISTHFWLSYSRLNTGTFFWGHSVGDRACRTTATTTPVGLCHVQAVDTVDTVDCVSMLSTLGTLDTTCSCSVASGISCR